LFQRDSQNEQKRKRTDKKLAKMNKAIKRESKRLQKERIITRFICEHYKVPSIKALEAKKKAEPADQRKVKDYGRVRAKIVQQVELAILRKTQVYTALTTLVGGLNKNVRSELAKAASRDPELLQKYYHGMQRYHMKHEEPQNTDKSQLTYVTNRTLQEQLKDNSEVSLIGLLANFRALAIAGIKLIRDR
jgi:hypothetical protein